jgi:outer membrane receptor protein involved in Fe transport
MGKESENGGFVFVYDYLRNHSLNLKDTGLMPDVALNGSIPIRTDYLPDIERHSGFLSGDWKIGDRSSIYFDGLYTRKESDTLLLVRNAGATQDTFNDLRSESDQYSASFGVDLDIGETWKLDVSSVFSNVDSNYHENSFIDFGFFSFASELDNADDSSVATYSAVVDGPIGRLGNDGPRVAFGVEYRSEDFKRERNGTVSDDKDRSVSSAFVEFFVPLFAADDRSRLDLSLAGRYDDYSDFGDSFNPQIGLVWKPTGTFAFRGSYSTAFRAPALIELGSVTSALILDIPDPMAAAGTSPLVIWEGKQRLLAPEDATTWSVGIDIKPESLPWLQLSLSYFDVDYKERIGQPAPTVPDWFSALVNEGSFVGLINRSPGSDDIDAILAGSSNGLILNLSSSPWDPANEDILVAIPNLVILDNRTTNIGVERVRGIDFTVQSSFDTNIGAWNFGLNTAYTIDHERQVTATSTPFERLNDIGKPVDLRVRVDGGWSRDAYSASVYVNYVDSYRNSIAFPVGKINSWTTIDLSFRFDGSQVVDSGFLSGFSTAVSVRNLLDEDPPTFADSFNSLGFDPTNSNPFGRQFTITFSKLW